VRAALGARGRAETAAAAVARAAAPASLAGLGTPAPLVLAPGAFDAAVLLALFEEAGESRLVLTRRAAALEHDAGHVALPGGHVEPGEPPIAAALRESREEIGLDPALVEPIATLPLVERPRSGHRVLPVVGVLAGRPRLTPNPAEVEAVLAPGLGELAAAGVAWEERWGLQRRSVFFFSAPALGDDLLWGLTARIVWTLLETVLAG
jgi:8-oxo-dGTP pyrophosphatase MutT (NUDIX family)